MGVHVSPVPNPPPTSRGGGEPFHSSGLSQCTGFEYLVSCIELGLVIYFTYGNRHVSMMFSQIVQPLGRKTSWTEEDTEFWEAGRAPCLCTVRTRSPKTCLLILSLTLTGCLPTTSLFGIFVSLLIRLVLEGELLQSYFSPAFEPLPSSLN